MAECVKNAFDFIKSAFPIKVGIICSQDANIISQKNNLSFDELIEPFCALTTETHTQGVGNQITRAFNIHVRATNVTQKQSADNESAVMQLITDLVQNSLRSDNSLGQVFRINSRGYDVEVNKSCVWFDVYRDMSLRYGKTQDHEFLNHYVACMLVVSSLHPSPLEEFVKLSQQQNQIQHNSKEQTNVKWMTPNTLKYYVLLHDSKQGNPEKAKAVFTDLQALYGMKACYLLEINSRDSQNEADLNLPDPWSKHMTYSTSKPPVNQENRLVENGVQNGWLNELENVTEKNDNKGFGCCLNLSDHDKIRTFMQQFVSQSVVPYISKTIKVLQDQVNSRKTIHRSFFKATKTFFGSRSASALSTITASYSQDANELNVRKLGDLCFLLQQYEQAYHHYHNAKKDYTNDQAWFFAAGASEMAALANFMQTNIQKLYPIHYMEKAFNIYSDISKNDFLTLRCTMLHTACLQTKGLFNEAAFYFVKMTDEIDDLRSGLLLEQAAHCYLKMKLPLPRKFAFHMILAGHRFGKCLQRRHSMRCYQQALQVVENRGWGLAEDNINFTVARQTFHLREIEASVDSFRKILTLNSQQPTLQQVSIFEEFVHVFKQYCQETANPDATANLALPKLIQDSVTTLISVENDNSELVNKGLKLADISLKPVFKNDEIPTVLNTGNVFSKNTNNQGFPHVSTHETFKIQLVLENTFNINLMLTDVKIVWKVCDTDLCVEDVVKCNIIESIKIKPLSQECLTFTATSLAKSKLIAEAIRYEVGVDDESKMYYSVTDQQFFEIRGPRLNSNKTQRCGEVYGTDNRLNITVYDQLPMLKATLKPFPDLIENEICQVELVLENCGSVAIIGVNFLSASEVSYVLQEDHKDEYRSLSVNSKKTNNYLSLPLQPNEKISFKCWIKAPGTGQHQADILVHYYSTTSSRDLNQQRFLFMDVLLDVKPGLQAIKDSLNMSNCNSHLMSLTLKSPKEQNIDFKVAKVMCSSNLWNLANFDQADVTISPGQLLTSYIDLTRKEDAQEYTNLDLPENYKLLAGMDSDHPCLLVLWNTVNSGKAGVTTLSLKEIKQHSSIDANLSVENMHKLLHWSVKYDPVVTHDFEKQHLCFVPVLLHMHNMTNSQLDVTLDLYQQQKHGETAVSAQSSQVKFMWLGCTNSNLFIDPQKSKTMSLTVCFKSPGIYNINSVNILAAPKDISQSEQIKIPQGQVSGYYIAISKP